MANKSNKTHRTRDSRTGRFVRTGTEKRRPGSTTRERIVPKRRKK